MQSQLYKREREREREKGEYMLTMHTDAHTILKPLQLKGALLDKNHAEIKIQLVSNTYELILTLN